MALLRACSVKQGIFYPSCVSCYLLQYDPFQEEKSFLFGFHFVKRGQHHMHYLTISVISIPFSFTPLSSCICHCLIFSQTWERLQHPHLLPKKSSFLLIYEDVEPCFGKCVRVFMFLNPLRDTVAKMTACKPGT